MVWSFTNGQEKFVFRCRILDANRRRISAAKSGATYDGTLFIPELLPSMCDNNVASMSSLLNLQAKIPTLSIL